MKKSKTYEISIIDKTYSKIHSDETKFYTSDTSLELTFKLKETEYTFESAEIVLFNIDDRSLVTRPVAKVLDSFAYELDDDITAHYGEWRGQLRFEQAGEIYVSSPVKFRIENDLSNERPPQLSDVQSWVILKRYADSLTEELKQAVLEVEGMDDTFNANESERQTIFETAEQSRQTVFDDNEANRTETFNTNEATRQVNETTRQQAESQRQSTFETNESERQSAEQQRIEAEILRVERDSSREVEITNLKNATFININNLVKNGNFSDGGQGWVIGANIKNIVYSGNHVEFEGVGSAGSSLTNWVSHSPSVLPDVGDILYVYSLATRISGVGDVYLGSGYFTARGNTTLNNKTLVSYWGVPTVTPSGNNVNAVLSADKGVTVRFESVIYLNLTQTFGDGNEPTKEVMDWIISENGYFNELSLSRDDIQQYELNQLRKAVLALGGTI